MTLLRPVALLTCGLGVLSACSSSAGGAAPAGGAGATTLPAGAAVTARLSEFSIKLNASSLRAGTHTFRVTNAGHITHALTITGPGLHGSSTADLAPGRTATLTVRLRAGKYDVFCPVGDHKAEGMNDTLTVR